MANRTLKVALSNSMGRPRSVSNRNWQKFSITTRNSPRVTPLPHPSAIDDTGRCWSGNRGMPGDEIRNAGSGWSLDRARRMAEVRTADQPQWYTLDLKQFFVITNNCFLTGCDNSAQPLLQTDALSRLLIFKWSLSDLLKSITQGHSVCYLILFYPIPLTWST